MFEKMLSFVCCCFPTLTSVTALSSPTKHKRHKPRTAFIINCPSSTPCYLSPIIIPCTPTTTNSSQHPLCEDSTMTSIDDSSTFVTDTSSSPSPQQVSNNSARISAIRELIVTEQRYVNDLRTVANEFIKPLSNISILSDDEIEQLFSNWFDLIACNVVLLSTFEERVQYKEQTVTLDNDNNDDDVSIPTPRSASMSNIAKNAQAPLQHADDNRQGSSPHVSHLPVMRRLKYDTEPHHCHQSPTSNNLTSKCPVSMEHSDENIVPKSSHTLSSMVINESTRIGDILCSYLPYMADAYFQYCNSRSQANKHLQSKLDSNEHFRAGLEIFQDKTGGLSLNGFLTKPIQRVTRYPLLIEKILKHTPIDHSDYQSTQQALQRARQLNERINEQVSEQENRSHLDWLQQHFIFGTDEYSSDGYIFDELLKFNAPTKFHKQRQLLFHGLIVKIPSGKELLAFLFNDFLLLSTIKSLSNHWESQLFESESNLYLKLYRSPLFLTDIFTACDTLNEKDIFSITMKTHKKPLVLKTPQTNIRTLWVRSINNAVEECQALEKSNLADTALSSLLDNEQNPESAVARLNLVIQEANILVPTMITSSRHRTVNPYCEITVGSLTLKTPFVKRTDNPRWNESMQFLLYNLTKDIIHINIYDHEFFSPNENIGYTSVHLEDILPCPLDTFRSQSSHIFTQTVYLNNGASIKIKCGVNFLSLCQ